MTRRCRLFHCLIGWIFVVSIEGKILTENSLPIPRPKTSSDLEGCYVEESLANITDRASMTMKQPEIHLLMPWNPKDGPQLQLCIIHFNHTSVRYKGEKRIGPFTAGRARHLFMKVIWGESFEKRHERAPYFGAHPALDHELPVPLYVVEDLDPRYTSQTTRSGPDIVNDNMFRMKKQCRKHLSLHGTVNLRETLNTMKFFGMSYNRYLNMPSLTAYNNMKEVFAALNSYPGLKWLILRNHENMPRNPFVNNHKDVDLLVNDPMLLTLALTNTSLLSKSSIIRRGPALVAVGNQSVLIEGRSPGDNYYDTAWAHHMLNNRVRTEHDFYIPNCEDEIYSLLYHILVQKFVIVNDYYPRLRKKIEKCNQLFGKSALSKVSFNSRSELVELLENYMIFRGYKLVYCYGAIFNPKDFTKLRPANV
eukprot:gb/GECG01005483.1/.p1 GENE.gb/GECG01005483.1/~~gb/GECG01005483.1/.p1  ORF type:complete len:421 (+),score=32.53 gb/GECG01005483.1/:1-1263(+)